MYRLSLLLENHAEELGRLLAGGEASDHLISHAVLNGRVGGAYSRPCAGDSRTFDSASRVSFRARATA